MLYPAAVISICFVLNCFIWGEHSSGAVSIFSDRKSHEQPHRFYKHVKKEYCVRFPMYLMLYRFNLQVPFTTMLALLCMWFGISMPLVYLGYYFGFRKQPYDNPVRTNQIPRQVPEQRWYMNKFVGYVTLHVVCDVTSSDFDINANVILSVLFL